MSNIALDWVFVVFFHWDVAGVVWATFLCQGAACVLVFCLKTVEREGRAELFSFFLLKRIGLNTIPGILQQSFVSVGNIFIQ